MNELDREAFEKGLTKVLNDAGLFPVPRTLRIATDYALAQAPVVPEGFVIRRDFDGKSIVIDSPEDFHVCLRYNDP